MRAAERGDAALGLHLAEAAVVGGDDDIAGQHQLDADGEDDTLHRASRSACGTDWPIRRDRRCLLGRGFARGRGAEEFRHVEARR